MEALVKKNNVIDYRERKRDDSLRSVGARMQQRSIRDQRAPYFTGETRLGTKARRAFGIGIVL